jgi:hypothetical protein
VLLSPDRPYFSGLDIISAISKIRPDLILPLVGKFAAMVEVHFLSFPN